MGFRDDTSKKIRDAKAAGDMDTAAKALAHYLMESGMSREEQQRAMDELGKAAREG